MGSARAALTGMALALGLLACGGQARAEDAPATADNLERAAALMQSHRFDHAAAILRDVLSDDATNRRAREMLAFALESTGDLEGERRVRSALVAEFPDDARVQADYGRVLERSGDAAGALRAYRRARVLSASAPAPDLDAAIDRMRGQTAMEVAAPMSMVSDPDAIASRVQAGAAIPLGSRQHIALLGTRYAAGARGTPVSSTSAALAVSLVRSGAGASWMAGPRLDVVAPRGGEPRDVGVGGAMAGRAALGRSMELEGAAGYETPWDEAAVAVLHGGRATSAEGHLYAQAVSGRVLVQAGARRRRLSILDPDPTSTHRADAWQSLWLAGADLVLWRRGGALQGQMLDETLVAPTSLGSGASLAYRHYDVSSQSTPGFRTLIGLAPRSSVDEVSAVTTVASASGRLGLELGAGLAHDAAREARSWRAGAGMIWAPTPATRFGIGFEEASEAASGLIGRRREGWLSFHVDL